MDNYAHERHRRLNALGIMPDKGPVPVKKVSVTEKGVNYNVEIEGRGTAVIYPVDGVAIKEGRRCDKFIAVLNEDAGVAVFLELKGGDISHAISQLESTVKSIVFKPFPSKEDKTRARIVSHRGVRSASNRALDSAKIRFLKNYNVELKLVTSHKPDDKIVF